MLFDIRRLRWDDQLCDLLGVDMGSLPEPVPSSEVYGTTSIFGGEIPVAGIAGDQQAALFGQACQRPGET
jgi:glycerol kinase